MKVFGDWDPGTVATALGVNSKRTNVFIAPADGYVTKLTVLCDGNGAGDLPQPVRPIMYAPTDELLGVGEELIMYAGLGADWRDFSFGNVPGGVLVRAGSSYQFGLHSGGPEATTRVFGHASSPYGGKLSTDTYLDGTAETFGTWSAVTGDMSLFASYVSPWRVPQTETPWYARLAYAEAQRLLMTGSTGERFLAGVSWYGSKTDPERGSFAIVNPNGRLAGLERRRIAVEVEYAQVRNRVAAYVHTSGDVLGDVALSRRLFAGLAPLSAGVLTDALVDVLGEVE